MTPRVLPERLLERVRRRAPTVLWLWVLWLLLWGGVRPVPLVGGLLVTVGVVALFGLPTVRRPGLRRPLRLLGLIGNLLTELVTTSVLVAWEALARGPKVSTGIVEVPLRTDSELLMASTALLSLMVPGSLVLEMDRERRLLYIHALPLRSPADVERRRGEVAGVERRLGRVFAERPPAPAAGTTGSTGAGGTEGGGA
ncbi:Na+/H+ antiporter subunit E [Streptomyces sp. 3MP-14]|uniref:Na+/H+ antiporter subunit E n=1 Tax=Streptomyces mimosae TaxID=2586635 RepID=A0A5N5ZVZ2_9ACTN|nr:MULTISPECIES: Na+/H+ antiporter subunit E [Streptomyces]KAB8159530.1 Na+/H+ antiporter subunit E [Streptomyces mimosae]KAB8172808.1 Na+/H+ antiporter subunit E [Streptomyces sp. 3MP-14]